MSIIATIDPNYINLHALLHRYFANSHAVFADFLSLPVGQAKALCLDGVDVSLFCLISGALTNHAKKPSKPPKPLAPFRFDVDALRQLPVLSLEQTLGEMSAQAVGYLAKQHLLDEALVKKHLAAVATLCVHYIGKLSHNGQLSAVEQRAWLALQPIFVQEKFGVLATHFGVPFRSPYQDGQMSHAFDCDKLQFEGSQYAIPNWRWLMALVVAVQRESEDGLAIGKLIELAPTEERTATTKKGFGRGVGVGFGLAGAVIALGVGLWTYQSDKPSKEEAHQTHAIPMPSNAATGKKDSQPIPDVAIVRVRDDKADGKADKGEKVSAKSLDKSASKPSDNKDKSSQKPSDKSTNKSNDKTTQAKASNASKSDKTSNSKAEKSSTATKSDSSKSQTAKTAKSTADTGKKAVDKKTNADKATTAKSTQNLGNQPVVKKPKSEYTLALPKDDDSYVLGDYIDKAK